MKIFITILFTFCFSQVALADTTYVCNQGDMERRIEVVYLSTGTVPCEVRYTKNGNTEMLWSAQTEEGYCDARAVDFVEKQRGWGWECSEIEVDRGEPDMSEPSAPVIPEDQRLE